jgi:hypothetical protein
MDNDSCLFRSAKVIKDRETWRFGSITYSSAEEAGDAIPGMDGKVCHVLFVKPFPLGMQYAEGHALIFCSSNSSHGLVVRNAPNVYLA